MDLGKFEKLFVRRYEKFFFYNVIVTKTAGNVLYGCRCLIAEEIPLIKMKNVSGQSVER